VAVKALMEWPTKERDFVEHLFTTTTHHHILFFTSQGKVYRLKAYEIPEASRTGKGTAVINILNLSQHEMITAVMAIKEYSSDFFLITATKKGIMKKTALQEYDSSRREWINRLNP